MKYSYVHGASVQLGWSVEGMRRIQRHAAELLPRFFTLMAAKYDVAGPAILHQVTHLFSL
jgi:hypothetical protein